MYRRINQCTVNGIFWCYSPLMRLFSMNFPVPILKRFEVFRPFSVEWFLYRPIMSIHKTPGYLLIE